MIDRIMYLRSQSLPLSQIARECGLTVGQVKYRLQKAKEARAVSEPGFREKDQEWQLPSFHGENIIKLMVQSPTVLFAYWEITWPRMRMVASYMQTDYSHVQKGIRLYDVTDRYFNGANAHCTQDIFVSQEASSWYIPGVDPGRTYIADFALYHEGRCCPILRSEPVATPRNWSASWGEALVEPAHDPACPSWFESFSAYSLYSK